MIAAPARLPSPHQGLPSTPWQALRRAAARISSFLEETPLRAVSRLRTFMAAIALALTPTPRRERLPTHRSRRRLAPPRPTHHSADPQPESSLHPSPPTPAKNHPAPPSVIPAKAGIHPHHGSTPLPAEERPGHDPGDAIRGGRSTPTTVPPHFRQKSTPKNPKSFLEKTLMRARPPISAPSRQPTPPPPTPVE